MRQNCMFTEYLIRLLVFFIWIYELNSIYSVHLDLWVFFWFYFLLREHIIFTQGL